MIHVLLLQLPLLQGHLLLPLFFPYLCKYNIYSNKQIWDLTACIRRFTFLLFEIKENPKRLAVVVKLLEVSHKKTILCS